MPEPIPDVDVRIADFLTFDQARVILGGHKENDVARKSPQVGAGGSIASWLTNPWLPTSARARQSYHNLLRHGALLVGVRI